MEIQPTHASWLTDAGHVCEYASAIFGIFGTALMSRRFVPQIWRGMLFASMYPFLFLFFQGHRVRNYFISKAKLSEDLKDSLGDMTLGINLLFWGFFLQLIALILK
jgi:hypothetical protein